ncbi:MAG: alpha/beta fold hydrolase [Desulfobacterales bacterium]|jgi:putative redox protein
MEQPVHFFNHQGEKLTGTLHLPDKLARYGVVFGHCFTCSRHTGILRHICTKLEAEAFMALRFDFSGNGQSQGRFDESTYSKQIQEMEIATAFIAEKGALRIGLAGHSMGAVIAILTAARMNTIQAVCSLAGRLSGLNATHFLSQSQRKELYDTGRVFFRSRGRSLQFSTGFFADAGQYNLPETISNLTNPLLIVHGDHDEIIPVQEAYLAQKLNAENTTLAIFSGADHMFSHRNHRQQVSKRVVEWFKKHISE